MVLLNQAKALSAVSNCKAATMVHLFGFAGSRTMPYGFKLYLDVIARFDYSGEIRLATSFADRFVEVLAHCTREPFTTDRALSTAKILPNSPLSRGNGGQALLVLQFQLK